MNGTWKKCSACKREIDYNSTYWVCSVSTCTQKRTGLVFCSVECWDSHIPMARHRASAAAIEVTSPSREEVKRELQAEMERESAAASSQGRRRIVVGARSGRPGGGGGTEVMVVATKVKKYIKDAADMNTSASAMDALTERILTLCDVAIDNAREDGRKTVMDRDVPTIG